MLKHPRIWTDIFVESILGRRHRVRIEWLVIFVVLLKQLCLES